MSEIKTCIIPEIWDKDSWHYKFVRYFMRNYAPDPDTNCEYIKKFLQAVIITTLMAITGISLTFAFDYLLGNLLAWVASGIVNGFVDAEDGALIAIILFAAGFIAFLLERLLHLLVFLLEVISKKKNANPEPNFLFMFIKTVKGKLCYPIKFEVKTRARNWYKN